MKKKSILFRTLLGILAIVMIPNLVFSQFYRNTISVKMQKRAEANAQFYIEQVEKSVKSTLEMARTISFNLLADAQMRSTMNEGNGLIYSLGRSRLENIVGGSTVFWPEDIQNTFRSFFVFRDDGAVISYAKSGTLSSHQKHIKNVYEEMKDVSSAARLYTALDDGRLYYIFDYKNIDYLTHLGKIIIEIDPGTSLNTQELLTLYDGAAIYLQDDSDGQGYLHMTGSSDSSDSYQIVKRIADYDLWMKIVIPEKSIYGEVQQVSVRYTLIMSLSTILVVLLAAASFTSVRQPIVKFIHALRKMSESDYSVRMPESGYKEMEGLETAFNSMADSLEASFQDAYNKGIALQKSETRLLTAQINPHFIFNVLETINMKCVEIGQKEISRIVTDLAQFLRGNIGVGSTQKITLREELDYVRYYIDLQKTRFGSDLTCSIDFEDDEMLNYRIPRLTIQPIVENAVVHGLEPRRGLGDISIRMWEEDDVVEIRIQDNGVGFDTSATDLNSREDNGHNHIAIPNIRRRLELFYGNKANLQVSSTPGVGTVAMLTIPIDQEVD